MVNELLTSELQVLAHLNSSRGKQIKQHMVSESSRVQDISEEGGGI